MRLEARSGKGLQSGSYLPNKVNGSYLVAGVNPGQSNGVFSVFGNPVACTLDLVGDKRSLLVVRDLLRGNVTFGELQNSPEGIPTNILADRLRRLKEAGLIAKSAYQEYPPRYAYALTEKGKALSDVLLALVRWGQETHTGHTDFGEPNPENLAGSRNENHSGIRRVRLTEGLALSPASLPILRT